MDLLKLSPQSLAPDPSRPGLDQLIDESLYVRWGREGGGGGGGRGGGIGRMPRGSPMTFAPWSLILVVINL